MMALDFAGPRANEIFFLLMFVRKFGSVLGKKKKKNVIPLLCPEHRTFIEKKGKHK